MGSTHDRLEAAGARLIREAGRWTLVVSETVRIDRHVLGSRQRSVVGEDAILKHVNSNMRDAAVLRATAQLFRSCRQEQAFEMIEGEWYPASGARPSSGDREEEYRAAMLALREEIRTLASKERRLAKMVASLEARVRGAGPSRVEAPPEARAPHAEFARSLPPDPSLRPASPTPPEPHEPPAPPAPADVPAKETRIELPGKLELLTLLKQLFGQDLHPEYAKRPPLELHGGPSDHYVCELVDADDTARGAVIVNTRACAELGGTLLGLPGSAIEEQLAANELTEDTLEGMSEVGNNLSGLVNTLSPGCHIRSAPLAAADWDRLSWVEHASRACVLTTQAGGALWLVAR